MKMIFGGDESFDLGLFGLFITRNLPADDPACLVQNFQSLLGSLSLGGHLRWLRKALNKGFILEQLVVEGVLHLLL